MKETSKIDINLNYTSIESSISESNNSNSNSNSNLNSNSILDIISLFIIPYESINFIKKIKTGKFSFLLYYLK